MTTNNKAYKYLCAASLLACIGLGIMYMQQTELYESSQAIAEQYKLNAQQMQEQLSLDSEQLKLMETALVMIGSAEVKHVVMRGGSMSPQSVVTVHWSEEKKTVIIVPNNLAPAPEGKQYQLWATVGGKPVDLGVFNVNESKLNLQFMKEVEGATAFAVTLEKIGGSLYPTLNQMVVGEL